MSTANLVKRMVSLEWQYSRNQRRHTAFDNRGVERFWIVSCAPERGFQGKHGYRLKFSDVDEAGKFRNGDHIQHSKSVKLLKGVAEYMANAQLMDAGERKK